jgi:hypothetical protein
MSSETRGLKVPATKEGITSDNPNPGEVREELDADYMRAVFRRHSRAPPLALPPPHL